MLLRLSRWMEEAKEASKANEWTDIGSVLIAPNTMRLEVVNDNREPFDIMIRIVHPETRESIFETNVPITLIPGVHYDFDGIVAETRVEYRVEYLCPDGLQHLPERTVTFSAHIGENKHVG